MSFCRFHILRVLTALSLCLSSTSALGSRNHLDSVALPKALFDDMVTAGMGEWRFLEPRPGEQVTVPRPVMCEGCGSGFYSQIEQANNSCPSCAHPVTNQTKRFVTPREVMSDGRLRYFHPLVGQSQGPLSAATRAVHARIATQLTEMVPCPSCGRNNNPSIFSQCYSCGTAIERENVRPAERTTRRIEAAEGMPTDEAPPRERPRSLRGQATPAAPVVPTSRNTTHRLLSPQATRRVVMGGIGGVALTAAALGIGYVMAGDDVHVSRGRVEVINQREVRIHVPGFHEPLILRYDEADQFNSPNYAETTLQPYMGVDFVDVWWTRDDGVLQILPLDIYSQASEVLGVSHD